MESVVSGREVAVGTGVLVGIGVRVGIGVGVSVGTGVCVGVEEAVGGTDATPKTILTLCDDHGVEVQFYVEVMSTRWTRSRYPHGPNDIAFFDPADSYEIIDSWPDATVIPNGDQIIIL